MSDLTLYRVAEDFRSMVELRAQMQELGEDTGPLDQQIAEYFSHDVTRDKIDNVIGYYRHCKMLAEEAVREDERLLAAIKSLRAQAAWLLDLCKGAMEISGQKKMEGKTRGYLLLKGNGGLQKLNVADASFLPEDLVEYKGTISGNARSWLKATIDGVDKQIWGLWANRGDVQMERIPHDGRIRAALAAKCADCDGGKIEGGPMPCPACDGTGKNRVPGARLEDRGSHVEVK